MKTIYSLLLSLFAAGIVCSCGERPAPERNDPETLGRDGYDEKEMEAAIARARKEVEVFIAALEKKDGIHFSVKAPIKEDDKTEHFWLTDVTYQDGSFEGSIGNEPGMVTKVKMGQNWKLKKSEISDWMYMKDEKIYGNYTMRPLLKTMSQEEADLWRSRFAEP